MSTDRPAGRRHDIDWLRSIALLLLIGFHAALSFQPWAALIGFPQSDEPLPAAGPAIAMLAVWRIPILFLVAGMGACFSLRRRGWLQFLFERSTRILVPWLFATLALGPLLALAAERADWDQDYALQFGHLWFLLHIYAFVLWMVGIFAWLAGKPDTRLDRVLRRGLAFPGGVLLIALPFVLEGWLVAPQYYGVWHDGLHGWLVGLLWFVLGFFAARLDTSFRVATERHRWIALSAALALLLLRLEQAAPDDAAIGARLGLESACWILAALGFASRHLDRPSAMLVWLREAVLPIYILHMPAQFLWSALILPQSWPPVAELATITISTLLSCALVYAVLIRPLPQIRVLFGMRWDLHPQPTIDPQQPAGE